MEKHYAVIGHPIEHSLSPGMHKAGYEALGVEAEYYRFGQPNPELKGLDYGKLPKLDVPKLEAVVQFIVDKDPELGACRQTVSNALGRAGMRTPRSRRSPIC